MNPTSFAAGLRAQAATLRLVVLVIGAAVGFGLLGGGHAEAAPLYPDPAQPANGVGYEGGQRLTPDWSPIQLPTPIATTDRAETTIVAHPYLSDMVNRAVPVPPHLAVELRGAMRMRLAGFPGNDQTVVITLYGHCVFAGTGAVAAHGIPITPLMVNSPAFQLIIEPNLYGPSPFGR